MTAPVIQFKRGAFANLPGLQAGEPALTTDTFELYVGIDSTTNNNKFFGSHRYWSREDTGKGSGVNLVEGTGNGSDFITLKSPDTLAGITTYTFPASPTDGFFLKTNSTGTLAWEAVVSEFTIAADIGTEDTVSTGSTITFAGTANEIETAVTNNQIQIGLPDNVIVGGALTVTNATSSNNFIATTTTLQAPTIGNYAGERVRLFDFDDPTNTNYAIGVETSHIWFGVDNYGDGQGFKWYGEETQVMRLGGTGNLTLEGNLRVNGTGISTFSGLIDGNGGLDISGQSTLGNLSVSGITTLGTGVGVTQFSGSVSTGTSTSSVPTSSAVIDYVGTQIGNIDLTLGINADTGGASTVATSQTLTISGTANEVNTSVSGQTITVGLPDSVTVTTALTTPTVNATNLKANDGTTAITITNSTGAVATNSDLTVGGNLYVNGSTTQVNSTALTVEDRTIDLGIVNGASPAGSTTWDLGILFNYNSSGAKKSAVIWEHADTRFKFASVLGADTDGTDVDTPQLTVTTFAPIEIGQLWVTDCAGTSQVISCADGVRNLENITIDAGTFV